MKQRLSLLPAIVLLTTAVGSVHADVNKLGLRSLVRLPLIPMTVVFLYSNDKGYGFMTDSSMRPPQTPESIRKTLRGDDADAQRYLRLGSAYSKDKNMVEAQRAWKRSLELYRKQLKAPKASDGARLAGLVQVLADLDRSTERDAALATALKLAPHSPEVWTTRISTDLDMAMTTAFGAPLAQALADYDGLGSPTSFDSVSQARPSAKQLEQAHKLLDQAKADADKAVVFCPQDDVIYTCRAFLAAGYQTDSDLLELARKHEPMTGESVLALKVHGFMAILKPDAISDFVAAARLSHNEPFAVGMAAFFVMGAEFAKDAALANKADADDDFELGDRLRLLPAQTQQIERELLAQLETLSRAPDKQLAARSALTLGVLQTMLLTPTEGAATLHKAAAVIASDPRVVDALVMAGISGKRWGDVIDVLTQALKRQESSRWRLLLAKTEAKQENWSAAEQDIRITQQRESLNVDANLALSAVLLRNATDAARLRSAGEQLTKTGNMMRNAPNEDQKFSYSYLRSIYFGLTGNLDEAHKSLDSLQSNGDKDQVADLSAVKALLASRPVVPQ